MLTLANGSPASSAGHSTVTAPAAAASDLRLRGAVPARKRSGRSRNCATRQIELVALNVERGDQSVRMFELAVGAAREFQFMTERRRQ